MEKEVKLAKPILIVDDSASMRQMISFTLEDAGYEVTSANNGKDALGKIEQKAFKLVITDLNMPEMDGIQLITNLRAKATYRFLPIIMLTTESNDDKKKLGTKAGASAWIVKPFTPEKLIEIIKKYVP